jgi:predicted transposase/invertase (TIGR01784 family)
LPWASGGCGRSGKLSILDIKARDQSGRQLNVEMQMLRYPHYEKRVVHYAARFHKDQLHDGEDYGQICQTISISFLDHVLFPQVPDHHLRFQLLEGCHHFPMTNDLEFHFLELPKFTKGLDELKTGLDVWLYFLRNAETMDPAMLPPVLAQSTISKATEVLKMLTQSEIERAKYEARLKYQLDENTWKAWGQREAQRAEQAEQRAAHAEQRGEQAEQRAAHAEQRGEQIGLIHAYELVLQRPQTPRYHPKTWRAWRKT